MGPRHSAVLRRESQPAAPWREMTGTVSGKREVTYQATDANRLHCAHQVWFSMQLAGDGACLIGAPMERRTNSLTTSCSGDSSRTASGRSELTRHESGPGSRGGTH